MGRIKIAFKRMGLERDLTKLLKKILESKTAPQTILRMFLETNYRPLKEKLFRILKSKKIFFKLSFIDIYPTLNISKMSDRYKGEFWEMVIKFGVDPSDLLCIIINSDYFFAEKAFDELVEIFQEGVVSKDRMKRFLVEIITKRLEFSPKAWLLYKELCKELNPSYDDLFLISNEPKLQSPPFTQISEEAAKMCEKCRESNELTAKDIAEIQNIVEKIKAK